MSVRLYLILLLVLPFALSGQNNNPFDIYRGSDTLATETSEVVVVPEENVIQNPPTKLEGENPFNISHIPIRKNQYQQIESLRIERNEPSKENISIGYLPLWLIIFSMCLLAYMLFLKKNHITILLKSLLNDNFLKLSNYEDNSGRSLPYVLGYFLFLINFVLFLYLISVKVFNFSGLANWPLLIVVIVLFFIGRHLVNNVFAWIYGLSKEVEVYDFMMIIYRNLMSVIFLVFNILLVFGPDIWAKAIGSLGALVFITFLFSRHYKGIRLGRMYLNNYFFHFFLYFCAFEISPWVIVYKLFKDLN